MAEPTTTILNYVIAAVVASASGFIILHIATPPLIRYLNKQNYVVLDYFKKEKTMVARPAGPVIIAAIIVAEVILYIFFFPSEFILAIIITSFLGFLFGLIDDKMVMGGWFKPIALAVAAVPILLLGVYDTNLAFPLFGEVQIPLLYLGLVVLMIVIAGNTINSIDVLNGVASGVMIIASSALTVSLIIIQNYEVAVASTPLIFISLAYYRYHKIPCKIFPGDSGALTFGVMYGTIAIVGQVEIIAVVILLPAVINSFLFLSSVKRVVEHRKIKSKPVHITEDYKLRAAKYEDGSGAPITLVRIIVSKTAMTEKQVANAIFKLTVFSAVLGIITAFLMGVNI